MKHWKKIIVAVVSGVLFTVAAWYFAWNPGPKSTTGFDTRTNGIWIGHQWYTGAKVRTSSTVSAFERDELIARLSRYGMRDVFIHAGPIRSDGTVADMPTRFFDTLRMLTPSIRYLPWIGGNANTLPLENRYWRAAFIKTLGTLRAAGLAGVHLDIEPLSSFHPGYLELLREIRAAFGTGFVISHATRRTAITEIRFPGLSRYFWSAEFYKACMETSDQTVLMGYDTCIKFKKLYRAFLRFQTERLLEYSRATAGHRVMIGIPTYEDVPKLSDPRIENIRNAVLGVRAALESHAPDEYRFDGVAVYAEWTTDSTKWKDFEVYWMNRY